MNRLHTETSPYLLQHAHNPVDWYAWKPEAFARAQAEDKPLLVSIGYSTCHWCHVMERESFENEDIAAFMNERFINIKVDREERPDVDAVYMDACQVLTGGGGWPLNAFLLPDGRPFFAGTYYPPRPAFNRPSWLQLLQHIANLWDTKREVIEEQAERIMGFLHRNDNVLVKKVGSDVPAADAVGVSAENPFSRDLLDNIYYRMRDQFDRQEGGFGAAPKFPSTMAIRFLFNYHHFTGNAEALEHARLSLDKMIQGGMYDQIGGGFARYSTDAAWLVPHFEKMLYDNALLVALLADAYKITGEERYRATISETLAYVEREMTHAEGGFFSAQDADSEGVEGKYYVWDKAEIDALLPPDEAALFEAFYGVSEAGNWEHRNILWRAEDYDAFAERHQMDPAALRAQIQRAGAMLLEARRQRVPPGLDDKCLLSWNALMCTAYAAAYTATGHEPWKAVALRSMTFMLDKFVDGERVFHTWKNGRTQYDAFLEDYAFLIEALIHVYEISFDVGYLQQAEKYTDVVWSYFSEQDGPLFYFTDSRRHDLVMRKKDLYDNATPSGNSTMALNLQRLGLLLDKSDWRTRSEAMLLELRDTVERFPLSFERWADAMQYAVFGWHEVAIVGRNASDKAKSIRQKHVPNAVLAATPVESAELPLLENKTGQADALIYVCRNYACQQPVQTIAAFLELVHA
ncbi:MAG: thioredoxin domain-containing protein [Saprospiraceae bacterium]|nr:thioredoxin domain-containing protein [Saprospiraceae bacterium]